MFALNNDFKIGETVRHVRRGSRYRINRAFNERFRGLNDGDRMFLVSSDEALRADTAPYLAHAAGLPADVHIISRVPVMVQIDRGTAELFNAGVWFHYESMDAPGQHFVRPTIEFGGGRFERCGKADQLSRLIAGLMPAELFDLLAEAERERRGLSARRPNLQRLARDFVGEAGFQPGQDEQHLCAQILNAVEEHLGGDQMHMPIGLDPAATRAVLELSAMQDLSPAKVVLQALRLYQMKVLGQDTDPGPGCMGD